MAKNGNSEFSSAFDSLLEQSRRGWDSLVPAPGGKVPSAPPARISRPPASTLSGPASAAPHDVLVQAGESASVRRVWDPAKSEAAAALFKRFGSGWRIQVQDRRREGDEFATRVTLTVPGESITKSHLGRGKIPAPSGGGPIQGSVGGISFAIAGTSAGDTTTQSPDERGFRRAIEDGLAHCVASL